MKKKIAFYTLGCKLNFAETATISRNFNKIDFDIVKFKDIADIYVINSCLVTKEAEKKSRSAVRQAYKRNPKAVIAIIGCYSELKPDELKKIEEATLILGNKDKFNLKVYIDNLNKEKNKNFRPDEFIPAYSIDERTRAFVKIQDGCNYYCTYCIVPFARGVSRSAAPNLIINITNELSKKGISEIILTGVNIGDYRFKNNDYSSNSVNKEYKLTDLLIELEKSNIKRFRLSSIEPDLLKDEIIDFIAQSQHFTPHFHIPLQSGSDKILKLMNRRYDSSFFISKITKIINKIPDCLIALDVIVGFPGETDEDFDVTYNFIKDLPVAYCHIFPYSEREFTKATAFSGSVDISIRKQRLKSLQQLSDNKKALFYSQNINSKRQVLFESSNINGFMYGFTENAYLGLFTSVFQKMNSCSNFRSHATLCKV
ncbi:MAG: tRNA (N(6)-L-threonylcarbamoyladenosine(37)-C(2))-methylthiotransferase MtaB, partial [Bacteroidales bacterium]|nr:tRNA (N(6)-L-threonylcarbamoyladenosine(37)-C(2))-methylthiotransferase MtaB [Bacteroidales bacterium]